MIKDTVPLVAAGPWVVTGGQRSDRGLSFPGKSSSCSLTVNNRSIIEAWGFF